MAVTRPPKVGSHFRNSYLVTLLLLLLPTAPAHRGYVSGQTTELVSSEATSDAISPAEASAAAQPTIATTTSASLLTPSTTLSATSNDTVNNNPSMNPQQQQQPKSLKFTLTAGRFWKFNIKSNSLSSHKEKELRLHKVVSSNNYIIDDDGWFQYNPQQQQLFAWPSLATKPATYYFVLLPSGIDLESDGENSINNIEVAANIIVELIRPLYQNSRTDIDQLIDHKFSLDYLHRQSSYPLLLHQIISVFDFLSGRPLNSSTEITTQQPLATLIHTMNAGSPQNNLKLPQKLSDYLLISSTYSPDGVMFSITWTSYPSLVNGSIVQINECRLTNINDIITKLSSPSSGYYQGDDKFVVYYTLDAPHVSSQAIVPTARGNFALKLTLNGPCKAEKTIEELGIPSNGSFTLSSTLQPALNNNNNSKAITRGSAPVLDADDKENSIADVQATPDPSEQSTKNSANQDTLDLSTANSIKSTISQNSTTTASPHTESPPTIGNFNDTQADTSSVPEVNPQPNSTDSINAREFSPSDSPEPEPPATSTKQPLGITEGVLSPDPVELPVEKVHNKQQIQQSQIVKSQPQAKSFANFLDSNDSNPSSMSVPSSQTNSADIAIMTTINPPPVTTNSPVKNVSKSPTPPTPEPSINEDFIGILNDVMTYLESVAVPIAIVIGAVLLVSIFIAVCSLCTKKRKSKKFQVGDRFNFRYGSERRGFLKNSSKPVILEADQKSLSMGGTPLHHANHSKAKNNANKNDYLKMKDMSTSPKDKTTRHYMFDVGDSSSHNNTADLGTEGIRRG